MTSLPHALARRRVLQVSAGAVAGGAPLLRAVAQATPEASPAATPAMVNPADIDRSGDAVPELQVFEDALVNAMATYRIPGGQMSIAKAGKLVYSRGFGLASIEENTPVERTSRFRIASCTKPFTGVGILKLIDDGALTLDTKAFPLLSFQGPANAPYDERLDTVTIEDLLVHAGGWDSGGTGFDPQYLPWPVLAAHVLGEPTPAVGETIVRWMLSQPLDFDPGTKSSYSNFGFNVLGRVIEHVSGQPFDVWMQENILDPAGITSIAIGGTTPEQRMVDEVRYYGPDGQPTRASVYSNAGFAPVGYGSYYVRQLDAHGGYIATTDDLVRFMLSIDGAKGTALLTPESVKAMESTPRPESIGTGAGNADTKNGLAWDTLETPDGRQWMHAGALEGSSACWTFRAPGGIAIAWTINTMPLEYVALFDGLKADMIGALPKVNAWPEHDLFA